MARVSETDAEAMSGGLVFAGREVTGSGSDIFGVVGIVNIISGACPVYSGIPALIELHFRQVEGIRIVFDIGL
jgi:hypothetical protein